MFCLDEMEDKMAGRVKSVLLLALLTILLVCYAKAGQNNPIDEYFQQLPADRVRNLIYLESWEQELAHAYEVLGQNLTDSHALPATYNEAAALFRRYAAAQGMLEACYELAIQGEPPVETLLSGRLRALSEEKSLELIRDNTLRIYEQLLGQQRDNGEIRDVTRRKELFIFNSEEAEAMLQNSGGSIK